ncbi:hypothetical protein Y032_0010g1205 [Ancylostoma ceylanicum]|uniref:Uncharacterized protein n=1 Tax=Ancylostoma ceylanicum TaxID=53326 RepID=A0A016VHR9_9BILA|nr:hypothetical protein Y032_0010g1205 [Ancylostoma ceylanicum]
MGSKGPVFALVVSVMMVVTGSLNTICAKWADRIHADGIPFNHPFLQVWYELKIHHLVAISKFDSSESTRVMKFEVNGHRTYSETDVLPGTLVCEDTKLIAWLTPVSSGF